MTNLLLVSNDVVGPLMAGPGIRAWEIARSLSSCGFEVTLASPGDEPPGAQFNTVGYGPRGDRLRQAAQAADAVMVQGLVLAHYPFVAALEVPLIVDVYDPFVLENLHARSGQTESGRQRHHATDLEALNAQLQRGDYFVCASEQQRDFWLGMLTALGRVNPSTYDSDAELRGLIDIVPFGTPAEPPVAESPAFRGVIPGIGADDTVVLWGGGIWNWFDPLTLIRAVAEVVPDRADLRLLFMGTQTPSPFVPEMAMAGRAEDLARELGLLDKNIFFNRGWVPYQDRAGYLLEADFGASCHLEHIETRFAFRTRLLDCIWAGLPMIVTEGDVLARLVESEGLGFVVGAQDVAGTASAIRSLIESPGGRDGYRQAFARVQERMTWDVAIRPLAEFLNEPQRAPDMPGADAGLLDLAPTPAAELPTRALEVLREGGPLLLAEELVRYTRWLRRGR